MILGIHIMKINLFKVLPDGSKEEIDYTSLLQTDGKDLFVSEAAKLITTRQQERDTYGSNSGPPAKYVVQLMVDDKLIGKAIWTGTPVFAFWCGYCYDVSDKWISTGQIIISGIPEITYANKEQKEIGWDHMHYKDLKHHVNLSYVLLEIWQVWTFTHNNT